MTWAALLSAVAGAVIALGGTLLADVRRDRSQRGRDLQLDRRKQCVNFTVALSEAQGGLRAVGRLPDDRQLRLPATVEALAPVYPARELLLVSGTAEQVAAGETAFHRLIDVRDAVRAGATLDSRAYHDAFHPFSEAMWRFRLSIRLDLGQPDLAPAALDQVDWSDRDRCDVCRRREPEVEAAR